MTASPLRVLPNFLSSPLAGSRQLATHGGALVMNVVVGGFSGFLFWIVAARVAPATSVAQAAALTTAMLGVLQICQQMIVVNVPMMLAASPRPGWILKQAYLASVVLILAGSLGYVLVAPRFADGLDYLRDPRLALAFIGSSVIWGFFSLQDSALNGILKGHLVLFENAVWGILRLLSILMLALVVGTITAGWIVATWLVPALVMVFVVNYYLFLPEDAPLRFARGSHVHPPKQLFAHMGFETLTSLSSGIVNLVLPAVVLTAVGASAAAPFFAAYSFVFVAENALGSFTAAYGVEIRRKGGTNSGQLWLTFSMLGGTSLVGIVAAALLGQRFMALLGPDYVDSGGTILLILALGLPFKSVALLSGSINRAVGDGWRNTLQQLAFLVATFASILAFGDGPEVEDFALALLVGKVAAASVAVVNLRIGGLGSVGGRATRAE